MPPPEPSANSWDTVAPGQNMNVAMLQVEITFHTRLADQFSAEMDEATQLVRNFFYSIAEFHQGKSLSWEGNIGTFIFRVDGPSRYDDCCLAAIEMLEAVPALNQDIQSPNDLNCVIDVSISCDTGPFIFDVTPSQDAQGFANKLIQHRRLISLANQVTITERIYRQIADSTKVKFVPWKHSPELQVALYTTPPVRGETMPPNPDLYSMQQSSPIDQHTKTAKPRKRSRPPAKAPVPTAEPAQSQPQKSPPPRRWKQLTVALVIAILLGIVIFQANALSHKPPQSPGEELVNTAQWKTWRAHVHETLFNKQKLNDQDLIDALQDRPPALSTVPSAILRHDAAIADVLLDYHPAVPDYLVFRFGIYPEFLGTGVSNPLGASSYGLASVHEYLVPNLPDSDPRIWMRKLPVASVELDQLVSVLVSQPSKSDPKNDALQARILSMISDKSRGANLQPVVRFAILDDRKYELSRKLGKPDRYRVFMSNLTEVWNLRVNDAAAQSGYQFQSGDTFFVWIFLPSGPQDAVPATWSNIFDNLPGWIAIGNG